MRWVTWMLLLGLCVLQYDLWFAKGGWRDMWALNKTVQAQQVANQEMIQSNQALSAEVQDLVSGNDAIAEIARADLGYTQKGEVFYRFVLNDEVQ